MRNIEYKPNIYKNDNLKNKCGVYQIRNLINNKIYVGSTKNLYCRKRSHFYSLNKNNHRNKYLQNAYNKYGKDNFIFEVIEFCDIDNQLLLEQYWIDRLDVCVNGYNIQPKADKIIITEEVRNNMRNKIPWNKGKRGIYSQETLNKMRNNKNINGSKNPFYGKHHKQETKQKISQANGIKIMCIETKTIYQSIMDAERKTGVNRSSIIRCCKGRYNTAGGYHWKYVD